MKYLDLRYHVPGFDKDNARWQDKAILACNMVNREQVPQEEAFTGWVKTDSIIEREEVEKIKEIAKEVRANAKVLVAIGIGGSYLGAKACIDFLSNYYPEQNDFEVVFVGNNLSEKYLEDTVKHIGDRDFYVNVISKSGGTLEPSVAFRVFKALAEKKYGDDASKHIIATTDKNKGLLKQISINHGYRTLIVPDNVGGRYSVLTAVGLMPIACAGFDIDKILEGAKETEVELHDPANGYNLAMQYAAIRNFLYRQGKDIEVFSTFNPNMRSLMEWLKQLFGETECKDFGGIFPASLVLTMDLHSMGQLMQQGKRNIFETFINADSENLDEGVKVPANKNNVDKLNYIAGKSVNELNKVAREATMKAHLSGNVPYMDITVAKQDEHAIGALFYFFEYSCAISAYMFGVNPFNQPGVEQYKANIKEILN